MVDPNTLVQGLVQRGLPLHIAQGFVGNMGVESGFDPGINEISPLVEGSRGGYGLYQLTGPRRRQYEEYARQRGVELASVDAQLDFLMHELATTESRAFGRIQAAQTPEEAARLVSEAFLRPGIPHLDRRIEETSRLAGGGQSRQPQPQGNALMGPPGQQQQPMQNIMVTQEAARPELQFQTNALNAADFAQPTQQNSLAQFGFAPGQSPFL